MIVTSFSFKQFPADQGRGKGWRGEKEREVKGKDEGRVRAERGKGEVGTDDGKGKRGREKEGKQGNGREEDGKGQRMEGGETNV